MSHGRHAALRKAFLIAVIALSAVLAAIEAQSAELALQAPAGEPER